MKAFADIADLPEAARIEAIGRTAMTGAIVGVVVDALPSKVARYINSICAQFPSLCILESGPGPVPNTMLLRVGLKSGGGS